MRVIESKRDNVCVLCVLWSKVRKRDETIVCVCVCVCVGEMSVGKGEKYIVLFVPLKKSTFS